MRDAHLNRGYTLLELLVTVSLLSILTSVSLISINAPRQLLQEETLVKEVASQLDIIQDRLLWQGQTALVSWTPWALWVGEEKRIEFPQNGPWQWQGPAVKLAVSSQTPWVITNEYGKEQTISKKQLLMALTYHQKIVAYVMAEPELKRLSLIKPEKLKANEVRLNH